METADWHSTYTPNSLTLRVTTVAKRVVPRWSFQVNRAGKLIARRSAARWLGAWCGAWSIPTDVLNGAIEVDMPGYSIKGCAQCDCVQSTLRSYDITCLKSTV